MAGLTDTQLREVFDLFDANGDGTIDNEEMGLVLEALGFGKVDDDDLRAMVWQQLTQKRAIVISQLKEVKRLW